MPAPGQNSAMDFATWYAPIGAMSHTGAQDICSSPGGACGGAPCKSHSQQSWASPSRGYHLPLASAGALKALM